MMLAMFRIELYFEDGKAFDLLTPGEENTLSAEWTLQLGLLLTWPLFIELWAQFGLKYAIKNIVKQAVCGNLHVDTSLRSLCFTVMRVMWPPDVTSHP